MSLDLDSLKIFVKVAELGHFTRAGEQLGMPKARVSLRLKALEAELGCQLVQRSTRVVRLTPDGEELLPRARRLLQEADELSALFQAARGLRGRVRIDLPVNIARELILPRLPELLARHPHLEVLINTTDRRTEPFREGFDCVLRVGSQGAPGLVGRKLGVLRMMNYASPAYLRKYGMPRTLEDLNRHFVVHYSPGLGAEPPSFEYPHEGGYREWPMRNRVTVSSVDAYVAACRAGLGIIQIPRRKSRPGVGEDELVEVLPELTCMPMPVSLLHTYGRSVPRRVRVVMSWLAEQLTDSFEPHPEG
ncbi:LysR family transcriptional regulator [Corallococcus macrosporus]|uniref:LysR family transcriptional regulator n=1 Tax=Myxococcus fulvus (strain ATCC BAA-855 / HW-1) TaxID=483219 RepID=F8C8V4_MYXFH|nr:LysR family transcriptional regulator [Corallococcus macrosporus]AEI64454.1 LysR family transcriptional regulator [Corallococcus macrosporus]